MLKRSWSRAILGAFLFLVLVGEPTVGVSSGLYTIPGIVIFCLLYLTYFLLLDSLTQKFNLSNLGLILVNFGLYSVLITGLLHGEIQNYVLHPHNDLITTLIRIQCSLFPVFAYSILNRLLPQSRPVLSLNKSLAYFILFIVVVSFSGKFGLVDFVRTIEIAPLACLIFVTLGIISIILGLKSKYVSAAFQSKNFLNWSWALFVIGIIPLEPVFIVLLILMIVVGFYYLVQSSFRSAGTNSSDLQEKASHLTSLS